MLYPSVPAEMTSSPSRTRVRHPWWTGFNRFFGLLGWAISGDDKDLAFARVFKVLGVQICLHLDRSRSGTISFQNTPKRVEELIGSISAILKAGRLLPREALALRGRAVREITALQSCQQNLLERRVTSRPRPWRPESLSSFQIA